MTKIELHRDCTDFVLSKGSVADKLRLFVAGFELPDGILEDLFEGIVEIQNPDGGIPFELEISNPSSVKETAELLYLICESGSAPKELKKSMSEFLVSRQKKDGGFGEALNLDNYIEDRWGNNTGRDWYPVGVSITWLTGKALEALCCIDYEAEHRLRKARDYLIYNQNEDGHWPNYKNSDRSDPLGTGNILLALRAAGVEEDRDVLQDGKAALLHHLKTSLEEKNTCNMVDIVSVGKPKTKSEEALLENALELIAEGQRDDGGWAYIGFNKSDPELSSLLAYAFKTVAERYLG
ncbi:MAG: prenyltransferase/squalene oxidase repeat-containing protein [Candidatus Thorarchaeota archaeon]